MRWPRPDGLRGGDASPFARPGWSMAMRWHDLLFMHWPIEPRLLSSFIPRALELDLFEGVAWLGIVPFRMSGVRRRGMPSIPWMSAFAELNVRTYVKPRLSSAESARNPGVWFFSLDAANPLAVRGARRLFHLPYYDARMRCASVGQRIDYQCVRTHRRALPARFEARYAPVGPEYQARPGSLDHWLTERYCLYAADSRERVYCGDILHLPWRLQPAVAEIRVNTMTSQLAIAPPGTRPLLHFARFQQVVAWSPRQIHSLDLLRDT